MDVKKASTKEIEFEIAATRRLLSDHYISGPRKRDLTKYLWRLQRELKGRKVLPLEEE